ncbi:hypothetical protein I41_23300 [Lacipirellula limnantheis]|uniref:Uncharacterized protein n=1 Tax=Lacipirellula limnantheis TaxID=2528024 RepID=A0A517TXQ3_9BACT|nr:hypothetical protein I41_23300 [Lacipirellula limnantheis]
MPHYAATAGLLSPLPNQPRLEFGHRIFHLQEQPVVKLFWIVSAILIKDERAGQRTQIDQLMLVAIVTDLARSFDGQNGSDLTVADCS